MSAERQGKESAPPDTKNTIVLRRIEGVRDERQLADLALSPVAANANTARTFGRTITGEVDLSSAIEVLKDKTRSAVSGNLAGLETTLMAQAIALDSIFNALAMRSIAVIDRQLHSGETYLRLALKAQSQCRATLQTLAEIKNPPTVFARQANIANGPQQVNNEVTPLSSRARENEIGQNKLLGQDHGERMDAGTAGATSRTNPALGTVGSIDRAKVASGEGEGGTQRLQGRNANFAA